MTNSERQTTVIAGIAAPENGPGLTIRIRPMISPMSSKRRLRTAGINPPAPGTPMVEHAIYYARRGWPVFPCKPTNKAAYFAGGFHAATTDEKNICGWWGYWPKAMIGVPMGPVSGVWAVDPDPPKTRRT